jgi:hypothetical protein
MYGGLRFGGDMKYSIFVLILFIIINISHAAPNMNVGFGVDGTGPWRIMSKDYDKDHYWDVLSFEWDYFMIHNKDGSFNGSLGYLIANPRQKKVLGLLSKIVPGGGNVAIAGLFKNSGLVADYENFDPDIDGRETIYSTGDHDALHDASRFRFLQVNDYNSDYFAVIKPTLSNSLMLSGRTANFEWDLDVEQDWTILSTGDDTFTHEFDRNMGRRMSLLGGQEWNVHMLWPRTKITGTIRRLNPETRAVIENIKIDAHGYRENSWGRWAFNKGGWDFATVSDTKKKVMMGWQTYHKTSSKLDFLDLGFYDERKREYQLIHFDNVDENGLLSKTELGWKHDYWTFDSEANQCVPLDTKIVAQNHEYRLEANVYMGENQVAMLSDATRVVSKYVIMIHIPWVTGVITRLSDGSEVTTFSGRGGGEFAVERNPGSRPVPTDACIKWGKHFSSPMPE